MRARISKNAKPQSEKLETSRGTVGLAHVDRRIEEAGTAQVLQSPRKACAFIDPAPVRLPPGTIRRISQRPLHARPKGFDDEYDDETLVYDSFWHASAQEIVLLGPPLCNLKPYFARMTVVSAPSGNRCGFSIHEMDRHCRVVVKCPRDTTSVTLSTGLGNFRIIPQEGLTDRFRGHRVLFTLSKNNKLRWIQDWIRYHRDNHGATAVLLYDNVSTDYSVEELRSAVGSIDGLGATCIVRWPFKYGPQGIGADRFWDSDYCQYGAWEHARLRVLSAARSALNLDIDELVVHHEGQSVFESAEQSISGIVRFHGVWVPGLHARTRLPTIERPIRYRDFEYYKVPQRSPGRIPFLARKSLCPTKWAVVPRRCPAYAQWAPHTIKRWPAAVFKSDRFSYRHFREINNGWKYDRSDREGFDPALHAYDYDLVTSLSRVRWNF